MKIGFTGTRIGMNTRQTIAILGFLNQLLSDESVEIEEVHHGCCSGADADFVYLIKYVMNFSSFKIVAHPSNMPEWTDVWAENVSNFVCDAEDPLERNRDIVLQTDILIACSKGMVEEQRSGTWSTIRFARKQGKRILIVLPDGGTRQEN